MRKLKGIHKLRSSAFLFMIAGVLSPIIAKEIPVDEMLQQWNFYGDGIVKEERGMLYMKEEYGSKGVMIVSPHNYGENVKVRYELMPMTAASVCVLVLSASDINNPGELTLPKAYDGAITPWVKDIDNYFFAFNNASHNKAPFMLRFPEVKLKQDYSHNVMSVGKFHTIEAQSIDGRIQLKIDGNTIIDTNDDEPLTSGHIAFRIRGLSEETASCLIKNVEIEKIPN